MKKLLLGLLIGLGFTAATAFAVSVFNSSQVGSSPSAGKILQTNGTTSTWVATSTLGIVGGSGNSAWTIGSGKIYNATSTDLVGIGTITPTTTLFVQGKGGTNPFVIASSTGTSLVTVTQAGRVGIGNSSPNANLTLKSSGNGSEDILHIEDAGTRLAEISTDPAGNSSFNFRDTNAAVKVLLNTGGDSYFTATGGNFGIGTSGPAEKLHVSGGHILVDNAYGVRGKLSGGSESDLFNLYSDDNLYIGSANTNMIFRTGGGGEKARIDTNGNLGIGESSPGSKLSVSGGATIGATYDTTAAPTNGLIVEGNVGIGTTTPAAKLDVSNSLNTTINISSGMASGINYGTLAFNRYDTNNVGASIAATAEISSNYGILQFNTQGASGLLERMRVTSSGNVGIGTTTPAAKLQVTASAAAMPFIISSSTNATMFSVGINGSTTIASLTAGLVRSTSGGSLYTDTATYLTSAITSLNGLTGATQTFATSTTATGLTQTITSSGTAHTWTLSLTSGYNIPLTASTTEWSKLTTFDKSFQVASTSLDTFNLSFSTATTTWNLWNPNKAVTLKKLYCKTDTGTLLLNFGGNLLSCTSTGASSTPSTNYAVEADVNASLGTAASTPNRVRVTASFVNQ